MRKIKHRSIRVNYKTLMADVFDGRIYLKFQGWAYARLQMIEVLNDFLDAGISIGRLLRRLPATGPPSKVWITGSLCRWQHIGLRDLIIMP